ncbi:hypothetical protein [Desulfurivibrio alkaliphilus]|uniref:Lipoprotein SmpA/OmlA domain-containing protein n=1 Tax=Desulfurivibrio alkaliphilus (strain DSM 19089 / UNIQEM U267 / AHT2) TaxID=589865 RepID=D6Z6W8_DESAT|nr:hypothetical protein [Desulfurivibrio alkaliphilus]ADH86955.1 hypothetical protein DaAHT2_2290 [Desulfurivibrio alkaliphilus AHT 2]
MPAVYRRTLTLGLIMLILLTVAACAGRTHQVRHLASDVGMLERGDHQEEVLAMMGPPDQRRTLADGGAQLIYLEHRKSRMKRSLLFRWLGHEDFHLAVVTLHDGRVSNLVYRLLSPEEFRNYRTDLSKVPDFGP